MARSNSLQLFVGLLILVIFIFGCSGGGTKQASYNFKQGNAGVDLQFMENAPPDQLYPNSMFRMILTLHNQMGYDIRNVKLRLIGLDQKYFSVVPLDKSIDLIEGKSMLMPTGETELLDFEGFAYALFPGAEEYSANYYTHLEFDSNLEFAETLCVNTKLYDIYDAGCMVSPQSSSKGQGAIIGVDQIESIMYPSNEGTANVEFRLLLRNNGQGRLSNANIISAELGDKEIDCNFNGFVYGKNANFTEQQQEIIITCVKEVKSAPSYMTTLQLNLNYHYFIEEMHTLRLTSGILS